MKINADRIACEQIISVMSPKVSISSVSLLLFLWW